MEKIFQTICQYRSLFFTPCFLVAKAFSMNDVFFFILSIKMSFFVDSKKLSVMVFACEWMCYTTLFINSSFFSLLSKFPFLSENKQMSRKRVLFQLVFIRGNEVDLYGNIIVFSEKPFSFWKQDYVLLVHTPIVVKTRWLFFFVNKKNYKGYHGSRPNRIIISCLFRLD